MVPTPRPSHLVRFGEFQFDAATGDLWTREHHTRLQDQPRQVLHMLLAHPGELVTRETLRAALWPDETFVDFDAGVNVVVNKIRHALRDSASSPRFIETIPRRGYRFIAPVSPAPAHDEVHELPAEPVAAGANSETRSPPESRLLTPGTLWRLPRMAWFAAFLGLGFMGVWAVIDLTRAGSSSGVLPAARPSGDVSAAGPSAIRGSSTVAVAPFENRTADVSLDPLGQLVAERIIRIVTNESGASALPRPVSAAAGSASEPVSSGSNPGAALLVTGTYYAHEAGLEFQASIFDAVSGRLLHGTAPVIAPRSRPAEALPLLEQKIAGAIAVHFDEFFGGLDAISQPPSLDVYREYRAGLETFWSDYPRALAHFERALQQEPGFVPPMMIKKIAHGNLGESKQVETILAQIESRWERLTAAERLWVELSRSTWEGRWNQALRILEDLERLVPTSLFVNHNLVQTSVIANRPGAAVRAYDRRELDERTLRHSIGSLRQDALIEALHMLGDYSRELRQAGLAQRYVPGDMRQLEAEARALVALGRISEVPGVIDRTLSMTAATGPPHTPGEVMEGIVREMRVHGYREESSRLAVRAVEWYRSRPPDEAASRVHRASFARVLYLAGRWEEAVALFSALAKDNPDDLDSVVYLGCIAARTGDAARASRISDGLSHVRGRRGNWASASALGTYGRSRIAAVLRERERAVGLLRDALAQGLPYGLALHGDPDFEHIRDYGHYVELMRPQD